MTKDKDAAFAVGIAKSFGKILQEMGIERESKEYKKWFKKFGDYTVKEIRKSMKELESL